MIGGDFHGFFAGFAHWQPDAGLRTPGRKFIEKNPTSGRKGTSLSRGSCEIQGCQESNSHHCMFVEFPEPLIDCSQD
jgi:hypothetical protein